MSDDDIDNMDFDLPAELLKPMNIQENPMGQQMKELESRMESMFPGMSKFMPEPKEMFAPKAPSAEALEKSKMWLRIYPCYINKRRKRSEGRKVSIDDAIENPCAIYMAKAAELLGFSVVLESEKRHPKDPFTWGRLRLLQNSRYSNKHLILIAISRKMEDAIASISDDEGLIAEYAKYSLSELMPHSDPVEDTGASIPSSSLAPCVTTPTSSAQKSAPKSKKKKEKRKTLRI